MVNTQAVTDTIAIILSLLCAIHCFALPLILVLLPSLSGSLVADESFHLWMVLVVIPISIYALTMGCKKHKRYQLIILGTIGLLFLLAAFFSEAYLGEAWEKILTLIGASMIALGHYKNYRLCRYHNQCKCPHPEWKG